MLVHHVLGAVDVAAIFMGVAYAVKQGEPIVHGKVSGSLHRVLGIIVLFAALFQELSPLWFHRTFWSAWIHTRLGRVLMVFVVTFQVMSGVDLIGWGSGALFAYAGWIIVCILGIVFVWIRARKSQDSVLHSLRGPKVSGVGQLLERQLSMDQIALHCSREDAWVAINGIVFDITRFMVVPPVVWNQLFFLNRFRRFCTCGTCFVLCS